jgi:single-strand DNA-binding protein
MAADLNMVALVGRLTRDAEQRQAGETTIQSMRLAFSTRSKSSGEWADESNYIDVTLFGREGLAPYLVKGTRIGISGRLSWREWVTKDGDKRQSVEVVANEVQLLDSKGDKPSSDLPGEWGTLPSEPVPAKADDSIPF